MAAKEPNMFGNAPMKVSEVLELYTHPITFESGHRLRTARCLICASMIGGRPARILAIVTLDGSICMCGSLEPDAFLICAEHPQPPHGVGYNLAALRAKSVREHVPAEPC